jgi:hypothetical protein
MFLVVRIYRGAKVLAPSSPHFENPRYEASGSSENLGAITINVGGGGSGTAAVVPMVEVAPPYGDGGGAGNSGEYIDVGPGKTATAFI